MAVVIGVPYGGEDLRNSPRGRPSDPLTMWRIELDARCWCGAVQDLLPVGAGFRCRMHRPDD